MHLDTYGLKIIFIITFVTNAQAQLAENKTEGQVEETNSERSLCLKCDNASNDEDKQWCSKNCQNTFKSRSIIVNAADSGVDVCYSCIRDITSIILTQCELKCSFDIINKLQRIILLFMENPSIIDTIGGAIIGPNTIPWGNILDILQNIILHGMMPGSVQNQCGTIILSNEYPLITPDIPPYPLFPHFPMPMPIMPEPIPLPPVMEPLPLPPPPPVVQPLPIIQPLPLPPPPMPVPFIEYDPIRQPYYIREDKSNLQSFMNVALSMPDEEEEEEEQLKLKAKSADPKTPKMRSFSRQKHGAQNAAQNAAQSIEQRTSEKVEDKNHILNTLINNKFEDHQKVSEKDGKVTDAKLLQRYKKQLCKECVNQQQQGSRSSKDCDAVCYWAIFST